MLLTASIYLNFNKQWFWLPSICHQLVLKTQDSGWIYGVRKGKVCQFNWRKFKIRILWSGQFKNRIFFKESISRWISYILSGQYKMLFTTSRVFRWTITHLRRSSCLKFPHSEFLNFWATLLKDQGYMPPSSGKQLETWLPYRFCDAIS